MHDMSASPTSVPEVGLPRSSSLTVRQDELPSEADAIVGSSFRHLLRLFDGVAVMEHCWHTMPRLDHGSCSDDMARLLVVTSRAQAMGVADADVHRLSTAALAYCRAAALTGCPVRSRMDVGRRWVDEPHSADTDARVLWGIGVASACPDSWLAVPAAELFSELAPSFIGPSPRSIAIATIGACEVLGTSAGRASASHSHEAGRLLGRLAPQLLRPLAGPWRWPEARTSYANATLCEALIAAGVALGDSGLTTDGLEMLDWLVGIERAGGWFSFSPVGGRGPGETSAAFDQQPIEAASMADACWRAHAVTGAPRWAELANDAAAWFTGRNDCGLALFDARSGGCADGLHADAINKNQGAESTIAAISAAQRAQQLCATVVTSEPHDVWTRRSRALTHRLVATMKGSR